MNKKLIAVCIAAFLILCLSVALCSSSTLGDDDWDSNDSTKASVAEKNNKKKHSEKKEDDNKEEADQTKKDDSSNKTDESKDDENKVDDKKEEKKDDSKEEKQSENKDEEKKDDDYSESKQKEKPTKESDGKCVKHKTVEASCLEETKTCKCILKEPAPRKCTKYVSKEVCAERKKLQVYKKVKRSVKCLKHAKRSVCTEHKDVAVCTKFEEYAGTECKEQKVCVRWALKAKCEKFGNRCLYKKSQKEKTCIKLCLKHGIEKTCVQYKTFNKCKASGKHKRCVDFDKRKMCIKHEKQSLCIEYQKEGEDGCKKRDLKQQYVSDDDPYAEESCEKMESVKHCAAFNKKLEFTCIKRKCQTECTKKCEGIKACCEWEQ